MRASRIALAAAAAPRMTAAAAAAARGGLQLVERLRVLDAQGSRPSEVRAIRAFSAAERRARIVQVADALAQHLGGTATLCVSLTGKQAVRVHGILARACAAVGMPRRVEVFVLSAVASGLEELNTEELLSARALARGGGGGSGRGSSDAGGLGGHVAAAAERRLLSVDRLSAEKPSPRAASRLLRAAADAAAAAASANGGGGLLSGPAALPALRRAAATLAAHRGGGVRGLPRRRQRLVEAVRDVARVGAGAADARAWGALVRAVSSGETARRLPLADGVRLMRSVARGAVVLGARQECLALLRAHGRYLYARLAGYLAPAPSPYVLGDVVVVPFLERAGSRLAGRTGAPALVFPPALRSHPAIRKTVRRQPRRLPVKNMALSTGVLESSGIGADGVLTLCQAVLRAATAGGGGCGGGGGGGDPGGALASVWREIAALALAVHCDPTTLPPAKACAVLDAATRLWAAGWMSRSVWRRRARGGDGSGAGGSPAAAAGVVRARLLAAAGELTPAQVAVLIAHVAVVSGSRASASGRGGQQLRHDLARIGDGAAGSVSAPGSDPAAAAACLRALVEERGRQGAAAPPCAAVAAVARRLAAGLTPHVDDALRGAEAAAAAAAHASGAAEGAAALPLPSARMQACAWLLRVQWDAGCFDGPSPAAGSEEAGRRDGRVSLLARTTRFVAAARRAALDAAADAGEATALCRAVLRVADAARRQDGGEGGGGGCVRTAPLTAALQAFHGDVVAGRLAETPRGGGVGDVRLFADALRLAEGFGLRLGAQDGAQSYAVRLARPQHLAAVAAAVRAVFAEAKTAAGPPPLRGDVGGYAGAKEERRRRVLAEVCRTLAGVVKTLAALAVDGVEVCVRECVGTLCRYLDEEMGGGGDGDALRGRWGKRSKGQRRRRRAEAATQKRLYEASVAAVYKPLVGVSEAVRPSHTSMSVDAAASLEAVFSTLRMWAVCDTLSDRSVHTLQRFVEESVKGVRRERQHGGVPTQRQALHANLPAFADLLGSMRTLLCGGGGGFNRPEAFAVRRARVGRAATLWFASLADEALRRRSGGVDGLDTVEQLAFAFAKACGAVGGGTAADAPAAAWFFEARGLGAPRVGWRRLVALLRCVGTQDGLGVARDAAEVVGVVAVRRLLDGGRVPTPAELILYVRARTEVEGTRSPTLEAVLARVTTAEHLWVYRARTLRTLLLELERLPALPSVQDATRTVAAALHARIETGGADVAASVFADEAAFVRRRAEVGRGRRRPAPHRRPPKKERPGDLQLGFSLKEPSGDGTQREVPATERWAKSLVHPRKPLMLWKGRPLGPAAAAAAAAQEVKPTWPPPPAPQPATARLSACSSPPKAEEKKKKKKCFEFVKMPEWKMPDG